jgi:outer membrane protein OmpA-like peptidoglycan-associated protein
MKRYSASILILLLIGGLGCKSARNDAELQPEPIAARESSPQLPEPPAPGIVGPCRVTIPISLLFPFDSSHMTRDAKLVAAKVARELIEHPKDRLVIEGHTCDLGDSSYNLRLGQQRADSAKEYLVAHGISASRIETRSVGASHPLTPNSSAAKRIQSRCNTTFYICKRLSSEIPTFYNRQFFRIQRSCTASSGG